MHQISTFHLSICKNVLRKGAEPPFQSQTHPHVCIMKQIRDHSFKACTKFQHFISQFVKIFLGRGAQPPFPNPSPSPCQSTEGVSTPPFLANDLCPKRPIVSSHRTRDLRSFLRCIAPSIVTSQNMTSPMNIFTPPTLKILYKIKA